MEPTAQCPGGRLRLMGSAAWLGADGTADDLPDTLPGYLVVYLACVNTWVSREALAALFWPERRDSEAQHNLRANLHRARALLARWGQADALQAERLRLRLAIGSDVADLHAALGRADWAAAASLSPAPLAGNLSGAAFALFDEWLRGERERLEQARRDAAMKDALACERAGDAQRATQTLLHLVQHDQATEDAMQALLRVAPHAGRREEALRAYERFEHWLGAALGLRPMADTATLAASLRSGRTDTAAAPAPPRAPDAPRVPRAVVQPPRLVGRDAELAVAADLSRRLVVVSGEPGVGKTRLLEEAVPGARWIPCREGLAAVPFAPLVEWLHDFRDNLPDVGDHRRDLARLLPELAGGEVLPPADALSGKSRLLEALARVLESDARAVVFDDLQWADAATLELVIFMARRGAVAMRLAHRSSESSPALQGLKQALEAFHDAQQLMLEPLSAQGLQALLAHLARRAEGPPRFSAWLHARSGGNPFFALQTLRALFEDQRLQLQGDHWISDLDATTIDYAELQVPARVADLVRRRLQALSDAARRVLGAAAVCGAAADVPRLACAVGLSPWATADALAEAEAAGLLKDGRFVHDVVRESQLAALPAPLRVVLHAAIAREFAQVLPPARIADHWWAAAQPAAAMDATIKAAEAARRAGLQVQALEMLQAAHVRVAQAWAEEPAVLGAQRARIDAAMACAHLELRALDDAELLARRAIEQPALPVDRAQAWRVLGVAATHRGRFDEALRALDEADVCCPGDLEVLHARGQIAMLNGRAAEAIEPLRRKLAELRRQPPGAALAQVLVSLGALVGEGGAVDEALALDQEAFRLARQLGMRALQVDIACNLAYMLSAMDQADRHAEGVAIAREAIALGNYEGTPTLRNNMAYSLIELGRLDEARAELAVLAHDADPTLALVARAKLVRVVAQMGDTRHLQPALVHLLEGLTGTSAAFAHAAAAVQVLRHGSDEQVAQSLSCLQPVELDPWLRQSLQEALAARGIDPGPYLLRPESAAPPP